MRTIVRTRFSAPTLSALLTLTVLTAGSATAQTWGPATNVALFGNLRGVHFPTANVGYASGGTSVYKTTNAGGTWTAFNNVGNLDFPGVFFISPDTGWIAGYTGSILKTVNGGSSWTIQRDYGNGGGNLAAIQFFDANTGYAAGEGQMLKTTNGGTTWTSLEPNSGGGFNIQTIGMHFTSPLHGALAGQGGLRTTTDGGTTWTVHLDGIFLTDVHFATASIGFAVGAKGRILKTVNGGVSWSPQTDTTSADSVHSFQAVQCLDASRCFAAAIIPGFNWRILRTLDGNSWSVNQTGTTGGVISMGMHFPDTSSGYLVTSGANIFKSGAVPGAVSIAAAAHSAKSGLQLARTAAGWNLDYNLATAGAVTVRVLDLQGRIIWSSTARAHAGQNTFAIPAQSGASGLYLLDFRTETGWYTLKLNATSEQ